MAGNLLRPPPWSNRLDVWRRLTTGVTLFTHLEALLHERSPVPDLREAVCWWKTCHVDRVRETGARREAQRRWETFGRMLWCFEQAARLSWSGLPQGHRLLATVRRELPAFTTEGVQPFGSRERSAKRELDEAWAYLCVRSLLNAQVANRVIVPVALCDPRLGDEGGSLATLELELMADGAGQAASHPEAAFEMNYHDEFERSMERAWRRADAAAMHPDTWYDARWTLRTGPALSTTHPSFLPEAVDGASASGAALRGWWYALRNRIPDERVVVMAQVADTPAAALQQVGGIRPKVLAVVRGLRVSAGPAIDTIVVADDGNALEARKALEQASSPSAPIDVRVVCARSFAKGVS